MENTSKTQVTPSVSLKEQSWFDRQAYPFRSQYFQTSQGRMHYIDEGKGEPIVMIHGTPSWSFVYRRIISTFSNNHRCIAPDHLGYGLSEKPAGADYRPEAHAHRLESLLESLNLKDVTLIVHDFGGPIGLSYALKHVERIKQVVVINSWLWSLKEEEYVRKADRVLNSWLGRFLYLRLNISPKLLFKEGMARKDAYSKQLHRHYIAPFPNPESRYSLYRIGQSLMGSSDWFNSLWMDREKLSNLPFLFIWGMKDRYLKNHFLQKWEEAFPQHQSIRLSEAGHFVQEDAPEKLQQAIQGFITKA